jgi:hypothetical protein
MVFIWSAANLTGYFIIQRFINSGYVEETIIKKLSLDPNLDYQLKLNGKVHWNPFSLGIDFNDFKFSDKDKRLNLKFKDAQLKFSILNLMSGRFTPSEIYLKNTDLSIHQSVFDIRNSDQQIKVNTHENALNQLRKIKKLNFKKLDFSFFDLNGDEKHFAIDLFDLNNKKDIINFKIANKNQVLNTKINGFLTIPFDLKEAKVPVQLLNSFVDLNDNQLVNFSRIKNAHFDLSGDGFVQLDKDFSIKDFYFDAKNLNGFIISHDKFFRKNNLDNSSNEKIEEKKKNIKDGSFIITWDKASNVFSLLKILFFLDESSVSGDLSFSKLDNEKKLEGKLKVTDLDLGNVDLFWPDSIGRDSHEWYSKAIRAGITTESDIEMKFVFDSDGLKKEKSKVLLNSKFSEVSILCCGSVIPEIKNLNGNLVLDMNGLKSSVISGIIEKDIKLNGSKVYVNFNKKLVTLDLNALGEIKNLLDFYQKDYKIEIFGDDILKYIKGTGLVSGKLIVDLNNQNAQFTKNLRIQSSNILSRMEKNTAEIASSLFDMRLDDKKLNFTMSGAINNDNFNLKAGIDFNKKGSLTQEYDLDFKNIKYSSIKNIFGKIIEDVVKIEGKFSGNAKIKKRSDKSSGYSVNLSLDNAKLLAPYIKLNNQIGEKADLTIEIEEESGNFKMKNLVFSDLKNKINVDQIIFDAASGGICVSGINYNNQSFINGMKISDLPDRKEILIDAGNIYYENFNFLGFATDKPDRSQKQKALSINGKVSDLIFHNQSKFENVNFHLSCSNNDCQEIIIHNNNSGKKDNFYASIIDGKLSVNTTNAGVLLSGVRITDSIKKGKLVLDGYLNKYDNQLKVIQANAKVKDFFIVNAPIVAQILSFASFGNFLSLLTGSGIKFDNMSINLSLVNDQVFFAKSTAEGKSLGAIFEGELDIEKKVIDMKGSISPFNIFNIIIRKVPIAGEWLVGNKGSGLFTIDFILKGDLEKPNVKVNPVSIFTPYAVKKMFVEEH